MKLTRLKIVANKAVGTVETDSMVFTVKVDVDHGGYSYSSGVPSVLADQAADIIAQAVEPAQELEPLTGE